MDAVDAFAGQEVSDQQWITIQTGYQCIWIITGIIGAFLSGIATTRLGRYFADRFSFNPMQIDALIDLLGANVALNVTRHMTCNATISAYN